MSAVNHAQLATILSFATRADLSAFDCSGLVAGQIAFVRENIGDINDPDNQDDPYYAYLPTDAGGVVDPTLLATANSAAGVLPGRWARLTWSPDIAP